MKKLLLLTLCIFIYNVSFGQLTISKMVGDVKDSITIYGKDGEFEFNFVPVPMNPKEVLCGSDYRFSFEGDNNDLNALYESIVETLENKSKLKIENRQRMVLELLSGKNGEEDILYFLIERPGHSTDRGIRSIYLTRSDIDKLFGK